MKSLITLSLSVMLVSCSTFQGSGTASNPSKNQRSPADESNKYSLEAQIAEASKDIQGTFNKILNEELKKGKRVIRLGGDVLFFTIKNGAKYDKRELSRLANNPKAAMAGNVMGPNGGGSIIWANWSSYSHQPATDSRGNNLLHFVLSNPQLLAEWRGSLSYLIAQTNLIVENNRRTLQLLEI